MKKILIPVLMLLITNVQAHIEFEGNPPEPTQKEIEKNRACFEELNRNSCGDPGEDHKHFRSCLNNVFSTLSPDCQKMMSDLYSRK